MDGEQASTRSDPRNETALLTEANDDPHLARKTSHDSIDTNALTDLYKKSVHSDEDDDNEEVYNEDHNTSLQHEVESLKQTIEE